MEKQKQQPQRLQSLDALRGFDMLFIMGGASLFVALATLFPNPFFQAIAGQMEHVEWNGLAHHDTIFPLFLFIAGISFPFSLEKQRGKGMTEGAIYKKIVRRGITLVFLGLVYNGLLSFEFDHQRCAYRVGMDVRSLVVCPFRLESACGDNGSYFGWLLAGDGFCACAGRRWSGAIHARGKLGRVY